MPNKMLIDASHQEETRVVVIRGNRIEEFDFESQDKKQLKGNIYLARVTRVEPSLQAAFVEYGGNRHGFLAFSEIHPDYYQIPVADRQALLRAEAQEAEDDDDEDGDGEEHQARDRGRRGRRRGGKNRDRGEHKREASAAGSDENGESSEAAGSEDASVAGEGGEDVVEAVAETIEVSTEAETEQGGQDEGAAGHGDEAASDDTGESLEGGPTSIAASVDADVISEAVPQPEQNGEAPSSDDDRGMLEEVQSSHPDDHEIESVGAEDALEEVRNRRKPVRRQYKIQEVIKRRQILLVQVVKEERGNKGAALTTYLSLAGRYSVLMPNTARGGGISRKITNAQDRKRLKEVVADLEVPQGMGVILRTAGESRTKAEIKRDYEYLMRLWENVRNLTLQSTAPALVYEEGSLIKRSVRDLYNKDIDEILVSGEDGYREAKDFMRMLMPSHAKVVQPYRDTTPIFVRNGIEAQLDRMLQPQVTLKSGGYIIINQTEALVSIDVNSGRSTKEHSIEDTALHTNLEAAEEVARQLRLRDLAGLIVIDFIDMEENRNNRSVEKRLKDHLKNDRARIQVGRISHFGLMEMSRQRIRASVLESTMKPCPHCGGTGHVRSDSSVALMVVRAIEEFLLKDSRSHITVRTPSATALYVLNHKRGTLVELESRFGLTITIEADDTVGAQHYAIFRGAIAEKPEGFVEARSLPTYVEPEEPEDEIVIEDEDEAPAAQAEQPRHPQQQQPQPRSGEDGEGRDRKRRKRRRRRGGKDRDREHGEREHGAHADAVSAPAPADGVPATASDEAIEAGDEAPVGIAEAAEAADDGHGKKRRRGKRGGKRNRREEGEGVDAAAGEEADGVEADAPEAEAVAAEPVAAAPVEEPAVPAPANDDAPSTEKPKKPKRASRSKKAVEAVAAETVAEVVTEAPVKDPAPVEPAPAATAPAASEEEASVRSNRRKPAAVDAPVVPVISSSVSDEAKAEDKPKRAGWWQRKGFF
ncbi:Rne/Rng family ribonuclease [Mesorhizobium sp. M4B.F.Ca.ET.215.01.1.1]|uniref:Rne/Rng family ribonuclease n=5 Tax=Mesorhizobium TaxID=68287 RepID=UPI0010918BB4|nr:MULTISPECIES: ribonuclease E/G [unclassified Mesorhizobium]TGQ10411.1 Rne/Rng family ribonuclease [Mesorhizobium sp. M4B.F.Ca.ET.215.01.1.1]TGQ26530.1 Rne/Rng family ribonuclease [Mesorhizobium sp. M00.F.Ca.ET.220.01.1.1]TGQ35275.1 Rne/Rng family ribonuclease [Mesorhizobium sp. M4B.F.Ca.ET.214.01.1.1]TGQ60987.1 Rne/Rng family ribonuclease [Mesorhizobium sp. M4B.F.Ca.ET.211.01.1.1]TGR02949.1 Rne/Rng family ribonuclease [Mesorhizobium sp. M4B.F.Ca.ET.203.01.1.1]